MSHKGYYRHHKKECCDDDVHGKYYHCKPKKCKQVCCKAIHEAKEYNRKCFVPNFPKGQECLHSDPKKKLAIVAPMSTRVDPYQITGVRVGDSHIIRNAGGVVTDDVIRSLAISQHRLGTKEIMLIKNYMSEMRDFTDQQFSDMLECETRERPRFKIETFCDPVHNLKENYVRILRSSFIKHKDCVKGFIYMDAAGTIEGNAYCAGELVEICFDKIKEEACKFDKDNKKCCKEKQHCYEKRDHCDDYYKDDCHDKYYKDDCHDGYDYEYVDCYEEEHEYRECSENEYEEDEECDD